MNKESKVLALKYRPQTFDDLIGQDELERIDDDTIYFIISTLNQLNIEQLRNKILLKVLPLKV